MVSTIQVLMAIRCALPIPGSVYRGWRERPLGRPRRSFDAWSTRGVACASSPGFGNARAPKVDCKPGPVPTLGCPRAGEDHSSRRRIAASLEHSDPDAGRCILRCSGFGWVTLDSIPIRACSGRGLLRRRSPGCRAWALTPRFQPCLCLCEDALRHLGFIGHRRFGFCCAFPRVAPGRR